MSIGRDGAPTLYLKLLRPILVDHLGLGVDATVADLELWQYLIGSLRSNAALFENRSLGQFWPHMRVDDETRPVPSRLLRELLRSGPGHALLTSGLFERSIDRATAAMDHFDLAYSQAAQQADLSIGAGGATGILPSGIHYPGRFDARDDGGT